MHEEEILQAITEGAGLGEKWGINGHLRGQK
jgi:hypothetical protein